VPWSSIVDIGEITHKPELYVACLIEIRDIAPPKSVLYESIADPVRALS
jgi:hypothetical protein